MATLITYWQWLLVVILMTFLAGCSTQQTLPTHTNWQQHQQQMLLLDQWQMSGKMGYQQSGNGGSAWIDWLQLPSTFEVRLSGPFGAGTTYIRGTPQTTQLEQSGKQPIEANSAAELTEYLFGWQWPADEIRYWVRGIPSPNTPAITEHHDSGLLATLEQAGWRVEFSRYKIRKGKSLPSKIRGTRLTDNGDTSFTLVINSWRFSTTDFSHGSGQ